MKAIFSFCLVCITAFALAQEPMMVDGYAVNAKSAKKLIKKGKVYLLTAGMPIRGLSDAAKACREDVQKEYGFAYYTISGDVTDASKTKQISDFNAVVKKHLACKHGTDWQKQVDAKLEACNKK